MNSMTALCVADHKALRNSQTQHVQQEKTGLERSKTANSPMMRSFQHRITLLLCLLVVPLAACETTQRIISPSFSDPDDQVPQGAAQVLYVTDRLRAPTGTRGRPYGHQRNSAMVLGTAALDFSQSAQGFNSVKVTATTEAVTFPATPLPFSQRSGVVVPDKVAEREYARASEQFKAQVAQRLRASGQREIVVFVHGYNNVFNDSMTTLANIWQASGRSVLPVAYTWPAGNPGLFGYFKDRESGEFSIFHFKETLRLLAEVDGLDSLHVIAHSQGTDLATTALREMIIGIRGSGRNPRDVLKIDNLILAAPDLDFGVVRQRLIAEKFGPAFECITVYMNPEDGALGFAQVLNSGTRFGRLSFEQLGEVDREIFRQTGNVYFIDVSGVATAKSHSYFRKNPEVLADIVALLTTSALPGSERREMNHLNANFWSLIPEEVVVARQVDR